MKNYYFLSESGGRSKGLQSSDIGYRCRVVFDSLSCRLRGNQLKLISVLVLMLLGIGQMWGADETKTEGFETATASTTYNSTATIAANNSDCSIGWTIYYGNVSTTGPITSSKSCLMRYYTASSSNLGYAATTTAIKGLKNVTFNAKVTNTGNKMGVWYSTDGSNWTAIATEVTLTTSSASKSYDIPSSSASTDYYIKIGITSATTNKKDLIIDDVVFTYAGSSTTALSTPTGMSSGTPGMNGATLSWNAVTNASGYSLTIGSNSPITSGFTTSNNTVSYTLNNLEDATTYTWKVKATGDGENYSDSEDCEEQQFTTASDPNKLKVTYDFKNDTKPDGFPTAAGTSTTAATEFTFGSNKLTINAPNAYYIISSEALFFGQTTAAYLEFPAKANYKLTKVVVTTRNGCAGNVSTNIYNTSGTAVSTAVNTNNAGNVMTFDIAQDKQTYNTAYQLKSTTNSKNYQFTKIVLTYVQKPAVSSISIKTAPTKTTYTANETFDPSGMVITVNYANSTSEDVTYNNTTASDFTFSPTTSTALNATHTAVTVTYGTKTANQAITVNRIATNLAWSAASYTANIGASYTFPTLTKTPNNLSGVTYSSSNTVVATIDANGSISVVGTGSTTITAAFAQTNVYAAATSATYTLTINAASSPSLEADPTSLAFPLTAVGGSSELTFDLYGYYLTADASLAISGTNAPMFSVVESVEKNASNEIAETITVTYAPTATAANHTATLTITSGVASATVTLSGSAKNRRTVTWYKADDTELTAQERGSATTEVWDGDAVTVLPSAPSSCDQAISFQGWTDEPYAKSDDAPAVLFSDAEDAPAISGGNASYYAVWANASGDDGSVEITRNTTNFPGSYGDDNTFTEYTLNGYKFKIQQIFNNSNATGTGAQTMQWRASGKTNGTGTIYNTDVFPGHISSIVIVYASDDTNKNIGLNIGDSENPTSGTSITPTNSGSTYTFDCSAYNFDYFVLTNGTGAGYTTSITINYAASIKDYATTCSAPVVIADPTFSPAAGSYDNDQSVSISAAQGMTIYYTTDSSNPKTSPTKQTYSSAISVTEDMTIMAIATDGNGNWSDVVTKTYTINYSPSIAAYIAKAQNTTRYLRLNAAQNCVVTAVKKNYQDKVTNIYCQDNSGAGIIIYNGAGFGDNEINVGDRIVGTVSGTWSPYLMQPEMGSAVFADGTTFTAVSRPAAPTVTVAEVNSGDAYTAHPMMLVTVANLYYQSVSGSTYTFNTQANGGGTDITIYDNFSYLSGKTMPDVACTIVGIMARNNNAYQVLPVELTTAATAAMPTISPAGGADAEHAQEVTYLSNVNVSLVDNEDIYVSVNDAEATKLTEAASITIENDTKIAVTAKRDFYADNTVTHFYKPSAYPKSITVTSAHGDVVVKVGETTVSTALPDATVTFTVTPENEHFHITSVSVTYAGGSLTPSLSGNVYSFTMPDKDATIVVTYNEDAKYSVTFNGGGATGAGPASIADQYAGVEITLPTKEEANYTAPANKQFNGWIVTETVSGDAVAVSNNQFDMPAANVTITAQWVSKIYCALTLNINGATSTTNIDREVAYVLPTDEDDISEYKFYGWAEAPELDDVEEAIDIITSFTPAANEASKTLYAVFKREYTGEDKEDELTAADLAATGTSYVDFSNVQKVSSAKYAGNSALNNSTNIQLRSSNSNSGIVSTVSGGTIKSVKITVASGSNTIDVYGSNTAYSAAADLYGSGKGTKIGSTSSTGTITPTAQQVFKYVGIRSYSGAVYLSKVTVTWTPKVTYYTTAPAAVYDVEYSLGGGAWKENEGCADTKVKGGQKYSICEDEPVRDGYNFVKWQVDGVDKSGEITISGNTTITAFWNPKVRNNLTYKAGTGSGSDVVVSNVEEGTEVTIKAIGSGEGQANFTKSGYDFVGWLSNGVLYKAGETFEMPAAATTLVAQWKKQNVEKMSLITSIDQLVSGTKVILACKDPVLNNDTKPSALAGDFVGSNKYLASLTENITFSGNEVSYTNANVLELIIEQVEGGWKLRKDATNYLKETSIKNLVWRTASDATIWTITFNDGNVNIFYIVNENDSPVTHSLKYNAQDPRFTTYASGQKDIQLYGKATVVSSTTNISNIGYVDGDVIVLSNDVTLTVDEDIAPTTLIVPDGSTVTVKDNKTMDANTIIVENGGTLDIETNGAVETVETLIIHSTLGKGTGTTASGNAPGSCGQIANGDNITVNGDVYMEIDLTQDAAASAGWYSFSVPFPVDALNGVYYGNTKLTNEADYAIMSYHGNLRAAGQYGWKKFRSIMQPGVFYVITVGDTKYKTLRFKKVAGEALVASSSVAVSPYPSDNSDDAAWNGIGNPNLQISNLSTSVPTMQFYDHKTNSFIGRSHSINLVVGSAFFIQYSAGSTVSIPAGINDGNGYLAPRRERVAAENTIYQVQLTNKATDEMEDNIFLSAREEATNSYEIGRDVAKMSMGTANCAQMYIPAYGTQLCAADFPLISNKAVYPLTITTPQTGTYTISTEETADATLYLTKNGRIIWNLSMNPYELDLTQGTNDGYGLRLYAKTQMTPTDIDNVQSDKGQCTKVIIDEHVYILRGGEMYDVTGKMVR